MDEYNNLLNNIKNAIIANKSKQIHIPKNKACSIKIIKLLYNEGFILDYLFDFRLNGFIIFLNKYKTNTSLKNLKVFTKKKNSIYLTYKNISTIQNNCTGEILFVSTSKYGIIPHYTALKKKVGGKLLFILR